MNLQKIPTTIVTGFLGAGKTTLLRQILTRAQGKRIAVIVNEFGELGIDGELLRGCGLGCDESGADNGQLFELANGCLCCTVQEEFAPVMEQLTARREQIDHLVIETSGLALPKPLVQAFQWPSLRNAFTVDAVVTVVDAPAVADGRFADNPQAVDAQRRADDNLDHESPLAELFEDQLLMADLVLLSKVDALPQEALAEVEALVKTHTQPGVQVVRMQPDKVDVNLLLGMRCAVEEVVHQRQTHHDQEEEHDHDDFDSVPLTLHVPDKQRLLAALAGLVQGHEIYRIKGFVALPDTPMRLVVQGVGQRFDSHFDRPWRAGEERASRLVVIGHDLDGEQLQRELAHALACASPHVASA